MSETISKIIDYIPFIGMAVGNNTVGTTPIVTRLIEAAVIGGVVMYGTISVLGERIDTLARTQSEIKQQIDRIRTDFYLPNVPRGGGG